MSSNSPKTDRRVERTRRLLREALLGLIEEKGYEAISVQDITERAGLNRVTFYLHYHDKQDLLTRSMEDMLGELAARLGPPPAPHDLLQPEYGTLPTRLLFEHAAQYASFYRIMLGKGGVASFAEQMRAYIEQFIAERLGAHFAADREQAPFPVIGRYLSAASMGVLIWWLEHNQPYSAEQMARWIGRLAAQGMLGSVEPLAD